MNKTCDSCVFNYSKVKNCVYCTKKKRSINLQQQCSQYQAPLKRRVLKSKKYLDAKKPPIGFDDITNLKIALNTAQNFEHFIALV